MKNILIISSLIIPFFVTTFTLANVRILSKYNHEMHEIKVFDVYKIQCTFCHNIVQTPGSRQVVLGKTISESTFNKPLKQICHGCHHNNESEYKAPQACYNCHDSATSLNAIKPQSHSSVDWKHSHAMNARADNQSCNNCHSSAQCVKCHAQRNDLSLKNHNRNYRFYHSIEARLSPQKCDSCHTKTFCVSCHMGSR